jgi:hypothetical protein
MNLMLFEIAKSANFTTEYLMSVEKNVRYAYSDSALRALVQAQ